MYAPHTGGPRCSDLERKNVLKSEYFKLIGTYRVIDDAQEFLSLLKDPSNWCSDIQYEPNTLYSPFDPWHFRVRNFNFSNVSFKQTTISGFEFTNCTFRSCLFISTIFRNCRFTSCRFVNCNPHRIQFEDCFIDPDAFVECIPDRSFANIGVYLFQELLRNSRRQSQPDFADEALYHFRRWQRFQLFEELVKDPKWFLQRRKLQRHAVLFLFDITTGSGMRLKQLVKTAIVLWLSISIINWQLGNHFGLLQNNQAIGFWDAVYFTTVVMTTLGFGDITPITWIGRLAVSVEAILGFLLFALLTSTVYRKLSS